MKLYSIFNPQCSIGYISGKKFPCNSNFFALFPLMTMSNANSGFKDGINTDKDYHYDDFGNMIIDKNKNIESITYNNLNLPKKITFAGGNHILSSYSYFKFWRLKKI